MKVSQLIPQALAVAVVSALPQWTNWQNWNQELQYVDWHNFKATGVNLGGWLVQEAFISPYWWGIHGGTPDMDEWTWCKNLGAQCGPVLEEHYASFITTDFIDKLASVGTTILRIPTTYAAWIVVPGSELYHGNQVSYLHKIATYAIEKYSMHVIIDMHGAPGGINGLTIGEATGHLNWWFNSTNLGLTYQAIEQIIDYIQTSGHPNHYTLEPLNEPQDNITGLFSPYALTPTGKVWLVDYYNGVIDRVAAANSKIPVAIQIFPWDFGWPEEFNASANVVYDMHHYYFPIPNVDSANVSLAFCADAKAEGVGQKFPVFFGEWSIQTGGYNSFADREKNVQAAQYAYSKYGQGSAMWTARCTGNISVNGQGVQGDYWNYEGFIDMGYIKPVWELPDLCPS